MAAEENRKQKRIRVTNPDDPSTYVGVNIIERITFADVKTYGQEATWIFDNTRTNTFRKTHPVTVTGVEDSGSRVATERVDSYTIEDVKTYGQETKIILGGNASEPIQEPDAWVVKWHEVKIHSEVNPDAWLKLRRIDKMMVADVKSYGQETQYELTWLDDDETNPAPLDLSSDGTAINPPWRLDPYQMIVDVHWESEWLVFGHFTQWGYDPNGYATLSDFNVGTDMLPASITLFTISDLGGWVGSPVTSGVVFSDTPTPSMGPLRTYTSPETTQTSIRSVVAPSIWTFYGQYGYTVIKLNALRAAGHTTLSFTLTLHTDGGGPPSHTRLMRDVGTMTYGAFASAYPLYDVDSDYPFGYQLQTTTFLNNNGLGVPIDSDYPLNTPLRLVAEPTPGGSDASTYATNGGFYTFEVEMATIASVSHFVRPSESAGIGVYTSRGLFPNYTVLDQGVDEDPVDYAYWGGAHGDTGEGTNQVMQSLGRANLSSQAPPCPIPMGAGAPDPGSFGAGPAPDVTRVYTVSVDLNTYEITVTSVS